MFFKKKKGQRHPEFFRQKTAPKKRKKLIFGLKIKKYAYFTILIYLL